ncbi:hypothetical protein C2S52_009166 [Perilla frutescens var. hirtella]|nr:hypothetical protein C2S52_009166 [Perilla frutescens var. hirtella]
MNANRSLVGARVFDRTNISVLGVNSAIRAHFDRIGWSHMLEVSVPIHKGLFLEFLSSYISYASRGLDDSHDVLFSMWGQNFHMPVNALNIVLGFETDESICHALYETAYCDVPVSFSARASERWRLLSIDSDFVAHLSRSTNIHDDALWLCHRFLVSNLYGRVDMMNVVTLQEVFILNCMVSGEKLNFGFWLARQCQYNANHFLCRAPLGCFVTLLAQHLHIPLDDLDPLSATYFTIMDFAAMSAGTSTSAAHSQPDIDAILERFSQRLEHWLDTIDEHLTALEQAVHYMAN